MLVPTEEQLSIVSFARETKDNLLISALAGAAKSSTLELIGHALPQVNAICLAFNKRIAEEMKPRLPSSYTVQTLNSLGHRVWGQSIPHRLNLQKDKCFNLFEKLVKEYAPSEQEELWELLADILRAVRALKSAGYIPDEIAAKHKATPLLSDQMIENFLEEKVSDFELSMIKKICYESTMMALQGIIDFDDQILMPVCFRSTFPTFQLILVDEAQDLSELNFALLVKLARGRARIIAVGDQRQAIYAFRGAHETGMESLQKIFSMTELTLSCSFRCPEAVVQHVRWRAPHMIAWDKNPNNPGEILKAGPWELDLLPDNCAVICRNNAPLFRIAVALLKSGRYPLLWGNDIAKSLISVLKKFGPANMLQEQALSALAEYHEKQRKRVKNQATLQDKIDCLKIFINAGDTLGQGIDFAETIFRSQGKVNLLTGHKAKGFEWDNVFFLDEDLVRDKGQDMNLRYVIATRAKSKLTYIYTKELIRESP